MENPNSYWQADDKSSATKVIGMIVAIAVIMIGVAVGIGFVL
ncbi:MAG: hypothetical protein R3E63_10095 [Pseudomonadales bacterium]